eukprot:gnl/TRDRNA2_/TRDRNA2_177920_c0_seq9.p1 gnl/TRDRNA2_/TRDRNA2_177920_c0~~gnl/TRDRNA2_/TRDRNA2_177920_c0_seq9.p1  ORF type:complete len:886 (-),score=-89.66 gnl/TRDRNA2_/TRDRNA2_177920_c0_seq9:126-2783(-)
MKKINPSLTTLIQNSLKTNERCLFVVAGEKSGEQVPIINFIHSKFSSEFFFSIVWFYKNELQHSSDSYKRMKQMKQIIIKNSVFSDELDPLVQFVASTQIRYCYYSESYRILGQTFGMCVLQDFNTITPNLLEHSISTVKGGGIIVILVTNIESFLKILTVNTDVQARVRRKDYRDSVSRFTERFIFSLSQNPCDYRIATCSLEAELNDLCTSLTKTQPTSPLLMICKTVNQAKALLILLEFVVESSLNLRIILTSIRGRGKSASLGLTVAGILALGYTNIIVSASFPENLRCFFNFVVVGLNVLDYSEHLEYELVESLDPNWGSACPVEIVIYIENRQLVKYVKPRYYFKLVSSELLVVDEVNTIPIPILDRMLGYYPVFICSSIYDSIRKIGLIYKLLIKKNKNQNLFIRDLKFLEPIRYSYGDKIENWLNDLLFLNLADKVPLKYHFLPHPNLCNLYYMNKDTLFSFHKMAEEFLKQTISLIVMSRCNYTPNDLFLISDSLTQHIFVLLYFSDTLLNISNSNILCVIHLGIQSIVSQKRTFEAYDFKYSLKQYDYIPRFISEQYQNDKILFFLGARVMWIVVILSGIRLGYGSKAIKILENYFSGKITRLILHEEKSKNLHHRKKIKYKNFPSVELNSENFATKLFGRNSLPPLLVTLFERPAEHIRYLSVLFELNKKLFNFWHRNEYQSVYLRQKSIKNTEDHCVIMLRTLHDPFFTKDIVWFDLIEKIFKLRLLILLGGSFRSYHPLLIISLIKPKKKTYQIHLHDIESKSTFDNLFLYLNFTLNDIKRLQVYSKKIADLSLILDLLPSIARSFFTGRLSFSLSYVQAAILVGLGLQNRSLSSIEETIELPENLILTLLNDLISKVVNELRKSNMKNNTN